MLTIDSKNNIALTKGDTMTLQVNPLKNKEPYEVQEGDTFRFACSKGYVGEQDYELLITKEIPADTLTFTVSSAETEELDYEEYNYDIEVTHPDETVDTFISAKLKITGESE